MRNPGRTHRLLLHSNRASLKLHHWRTQTFIGIYLLKLHTGISFISTFKSHRMELKPPFPCSPARNLGGLESEFLEAEPLGSKPSKGFPFKFSKAFSKQNRTKVK